MDKITHEVRIANWTKIVEQCNNRPEGMTVKQWLADKDINEKQYYYWLRRVRQETYNKKAVRLPAVAEKQAQSSKSTVAFAEIPLPDRSESVGDPFHADAVIHTGSLMIGISNSISDRLLSRLLEVDHHAR